MSSPETFWVSPHLDVGLSPQKSTYQKKNATCRLLKMVFPLTMNSSNIIFQKSKSKKITTSEFPTWKHPVHHLGSSDLKNRSLLEVQGQGNGHPFEDKAREPNHLPRIFVLIWKVKKRRKKNGSCPWEKWGDYIIDVNIDEKNLLETAFFRCHSESTTKFDTPRVFFWRSLTPELTAMNLGLITILLQNGSLCAAVQLTRAKMHP